MCRIRGPVICLPMREKHLWYSYTNYAQSLFDALQKQMLAYRNVIVRNLLNFLSMLQSFLQCNQDVFVMVINLSFYMVYQLFGWSCEYCTSFLHAEQGIDYVIITTIIIYFLFVSFWNISQLKYLNSNLFKVHPNLLIVCCCCCCWLFLFNCSR